MINGSKSNDSVKEYEAFADKKFEEVYNVIKADIDGYIKNEKTKLINTEEFKLLEEKHQELIDELFNIFGNNFKQGDDLE